MSEQVKLYRYDPLTHLIETDYQNAKPHECLAVVKPTAEKTDKCSRPHLEDIELFCPNGCNQPPTINNNIEVKPTITTGSSFQRKAMIFTAGAITTFAAIQFGPTVAAYAFLRASHTIKNVVYTIGMSTLTKVLTVITNVGAYLGSQLISLLGKTTVPSIANPVEIIPTKIEETIDPAKAFDLSAIKPPTSFLTSSRMFTLVLGIITFGMVRSKI